MEKLFYYSDVDYDLLKIKPDSKLTNTGYEGILNAIHSTISNKISISELDFSKKNEYISIEFNNPITYEILFDGDNLSSTPYFYFGIPKKFSKYMKQRIQTVLPQSTLTIENEDFYNAINNTFTNCYSYQYKYQKDCLLSLKTTQANFLEAILNVKNEIQESEALLFQVQMIPCSNFWKTTHTERFDKAKKEGVNINNEGFIIKSIDFVGMSCMQLLNVADNLFGYDNPNKFEVPNLKKQVSTTDFSSSTKTKINYDGFYVRIKLYVSGCDKLKADSYAETFQVCMRELEEDNTLIISKKKKQDNITRRVFFDKHSIMSTKELMNIINIPNTKLQRTFKISNVDMKQVSTPKECKNGFIRIGSLEYYGETQIAYYPKDRDNLATTKIYLTGLGGGKSNTLLNYAEDVVKNNKCLIDINYVDRCQLAYAIKSRHKNHILIDLSDDDSLPSFMLPEISIEDTDSIKTKKRKADDWATEVEYIINSIVVKGTEAISPRMSQYLFSACKIVAIRNNAKIKTAFDILEDKKIRNDYIRLAIDSGIYTEEDYEIRKLEELDKDTKKIDGVLDRYSVLMKNTTFQLMLNSDNPQFNFIDIMDNNKSISICMPESAFKNKVTKDIIITYLMSRIRLAMLSRVNRNEVCHILLDEAHHLKKSLDVISDSIAEPRKYGLSFVFATHYFNQLGDKLKEAMMNIGASYILIKGVGESTFNEIKDKVDDEFSYEDIKEMPERHSLNVIWVNGKYHTFITKMNPLLLDEKGNKYI